MDTLNVSTSKTRKSPSPAKTHGDYQPQLRKSVMFNESELDPKMKHWEEYKVKGIKIPRRSYHSSAAHSNSLYVYGGYEVNTGNLEDFLKVNLDESNSAFEWEEVTVSSSVKPGPRSRHTSVVYQDKMYLYGGQINSVSNTNKLMSFDFIKNEWAVLTPKTGTHVPSIDSHVSILWDRGEDKVSMVVVGGFLSGHDGGYSNGVYEYDIKENEWRVLFQNKEVDTTSETPTLPQGRTGLGAAIHKDVLYIFGGNEGNTKLNDLWKFDLKEKKWSPLKAEGVYPEPRNGHSLVCFRDVLIIFGGILDITHEKNDIFIYNISKNTWVAVEKETKWIVDNEKNPSGSPQKKPEDSKKERSSSPHKRNQPYAKGLLQGKTDYSMDMGSEDGANSPGRDKSLNATLTGTAKSPSKYQKLKLLESPTKSGHVTGALNGDESGSPPKQSSLKSSLEEKNKRDKLLKKMMLLKEFEVDDEKAKEDLTVVTPALEAMQNSIKGLGLGDDSKEKAENALSTTMAGLDAIRAHAEKPTDSNSSIRVGAKPVARDGHSASIVGEKMFIFGGDRHKMSFNDLFALNLRFFDSLHF